MSKIFISYRRDDSAPWAGRLYDHIEAKFQPEQIFMDIDMEPGLDFVEEIEGAVSSCDVLIAVIGPQWLGISDDAGRRRIDGEQDWVRLEIATALARKIRVIPCLVDKARMPRGAELPEDLALLARRQAVTLTHERFRADVERVTKVIARILGGKPKVERPKREAAPRSRPAVADRAASPSVPAEPVEKGQVITAQGLEYVWIPPGTFQMGALPDDDLARNNEKPRHEVEITAGLWMSRTAVTVGSYKVFTEATGREMPEAPEFNARWNKQNHPVVNVSWENATAYCEWAGGRLPSEAEWEYAARGGKSGLLYPHGNELTKRDAQYDSSDGTAEVGRYAPNGYGLYDMAGNVWEWCSDWYGEEYYKSSPRQDPQGPSNGDYRVLRGGSWYYYPWYLRVSGRSWVPPDFRSSGFGFRCVREENP